MQILISEKIHTSSRLGRVGTLFQPPTFSSFIPRQPFIRLARQQDEINIQPLIIGPMVRHLKSCFKIDPSLGLA